MLLKELYREPVRREPVVGEKRSKVNVVDNSVLRTMAVAEAGDARPLDWFRYSEPAFVKTTACYRRQHTIVERVL